MTETPKAILYRSLNELRSRESGLFAELEDCQNAIRVLENILPQGEKKAQEDIPPDQEEKKQDKGRTITLELVRDAVIQLGKNPPAPVGNNAYTTQPGFFVISHVAALLQCSVTNHKLKVALKTLHEKGIIEAKKYRNGQQYRYVTPQETGPGSAHLVSAHDSETGELLWSGDLDGKTPVDGTGAKKLWTSNKDIHKLISRAKRNGASVRQFTNGHINVSNGNGTSVTISSTAKDPAKVKRDLQQLGISV